MEGTAALHARNVIATGFRGYAIEVRGGAAERFAAGASSLGNAIFWLNDRGTHPLVAPHLVPLVLLLPPDLNDRGTPPLAAPLAEARRRDPRLLNVRLEPNPDPRPRSGSPALVPENAAVPPFGGPRYRRAPYVGAFGRENWLEQWTWFGREEQYRATETE